MPTRTILILLALCLVSVLAINYTFRPPEEVIVSVLSDGKVRIAGKELPMDQVTSHLEEKFPEKGRTIIIYKMDADAEVQSIIPLVHETENAGYVEVELKLNPE